MKVRFVLLMLVMLVAGIGTAVALANDPPGRDPCSHGNSNKPCRDDPSPNGKDCDQHGKQGGVNEDHCTTTDDTTTTTTTTTVPTTTTQTTTTTAPTTTTTTTTQPPVTTTQTTPTTTTTVDTPPVVTPAVKPPAKHTDPPAKVKHHKHVAPPVKHTATKPKPPVCPPGKPFAGTCGVQGSG